MRSSSFNLRWLLLITAMCLVNIANGAEANAHTRTLASSCVICHGSSPVSNVGIPSLVGVDKTYFIKKMQEYRNTAQPHEVMAQHAKGLTEEEIVALAEFYSSLPRGCPAKKKPSFIKVEEE